MADLSPAAQAIWEAFNQDDPGVFVDYGNCLAAALRAAADQVVPVTPKPNDTFCCPPVDTIVWMRVAKIRDKLLAVAAELEAQQ
jgi:hypothetical protein